MAMIARRQRWLSQPPAGAEPSAAAVAGYGITGLWSASDPQRAWSRLRARWVPSTLPTLNHRFVASPWGQSLQLQSGGPSGAGLIPGLTTEDWIGASGNRWSIALAVSYPDPSARLSFLAWVQSGAAQLTIHAPWVDGNLYFDSPTRIVVGGYGKPSVGRRDTFVAVADGADRWVYRNGELLTTGTSANITPSSADRLFLLADSGSSLVDTTQLSQLTLSDRPWSDAQVREWHATPWQVYAPAVRRLYFTASAGPSGITGTSTATLASVTGAAAGTVAIAGASTATLTDVAGTATGTVAVSGASTAAVAAVTGTATGSVVSGVVGSSTATLGAITGTAAGTVRVAGASAQSVGAVAGTAAGQIIVTGLSSATLAAITGSATGTVGTAPVLGSSSASIAGVTGSASGTVRVGGASAATVGAVTGSATGTTLQIIVGASVRTLDAVTGVATGTVSDLAPSAPYGVSIGQRVQSAGRPASLQSSRRQNIQRGTR